VKHDILPAFMVYRSTYESYLASANISAISDEQSLRHDAVTSLRLTVRSLTEEVKLLVDLLRRAGVGTLDTAAGIHSERSYHATSHYERSLISLVTRRDETRQMKHDRRRQKRNRTSVEVD